MRASYFFNDNRPNSTDYDDVLMVIGFGRMHVWMLLSTGLLLMLGVCETMGMAIIAPSAKCDLHIDEAMQAKLTAMPFLGIICSSYFWGYFCDIHGRRKVLIYSGFITVCVSIISLLMPTYLTFGLMRFVVGLFVAASTSVSLTYLSELCTNQQRVLVLNYMFLFQGVGMIYCPGIATLFLEVDWYLPYFNDMEFGPWRVLGFIYTLPGLIGVLIMLNMPESPKFQLAIGNDEAAFKTLDRLCIANNDGKQLSDYGIHTIRCAARRTIANESYTLLRLMWSDAKPIFKRPYVLRFAVSSIIMFCLFTIANGMGLWFTDMRNRIDDINPPVGKTTVCNIMTAATINDVEIENFVCIDGFRGFNDSILLGAAFIAGYLILGALLRHISRKVVFITSLTLSSICGFGLQWITNEIYIRIFFILFLVLPTIVINLLSGSVVEFVPTYLRGKAICLCMMFGRLGVIFGTQIMGNFLTNNCFGAFLFLSFFPILGALLAFSFLSL